MLADFLPRLITSIVLATLFIVLYLYFPLGLSCMFAVALVIILLCEWPHIGVWWVTPWYPVLPCLLLIMLNQSPYRSLLIFIFVLSAVFDSAGYFIGSTIGRHKIAPVISPRKTWEGFIAGFIAAFATAPFLMHFLPMKNLGWWFFPFIAVYCCLAFAGDLIVSSFKRSVHYKDSGNLLPGHGGLLDRLASIFPTVVYVYILKSKIMAL